MDPRDEDNKAPAYTIRKAQRSSAKPIVGLYSLSGGGKTYSSLILARGCVGPSGRIVMIETEEGRGEAYADAGEHPEIGGYEVIPMTGNFSPRAYGAAIDVANKALPDALIVDSGSHEWAGIGGVLDMAYKNEEAGKKGLQVWQKPKIDHQMYFLNRLLQTPIPLVILNLRAKYPMVETVQNGRKVPTRSDVLEPIQSEDILYELFVHGWIDREHKFHVGNSPLASLRAIFPDKEPITLETGQKLRAWMDGRAKPGSKGTGINLYGVDGSVLSRHERLGEWLDAFVAKIGEAPDPDNAQAFWESNEANFTAGMEKAAGNPEAAKKFNDAAKFAMEKRTPPMPEEDNQLPL